jgi:hypothetical protein
MARQSVLNNLWDTHRIPEKNEYIHRINSDDNLQYLMVREQTHCRGIVPAWPLEKRMEVLSRVVKTFRNMVPHVTDPTARDYIVKWLERSKTEKTSPVNEHANDGAVEGYMVMNPYGNDHGRMYIKVQQLGPNNQPLPETSLFALTFNLALHEMVHGIWGLPNHEPPFDQRHEQLRGYAKKLNIPGF